MAALDTITDISTLLDKWKEAERLHQNPVEILERFVHEIRRYLRCILMIFYYAVKSYTHTKVI
jgi:hypothetical protein